MLTSRVHSSDDARLIAQRSWLSHSQRDSTHAMRVMESFAKCIWHSFVRRAPRLLSKFPRISTRFLEEHQPIDRPPLSPQKEKGKEKKKKKEKFQHRSRRNPQSMYLKSGFRSPSVDLS